MTAAGLATPLFIFALVVIFVPWLIWGFAIHTERLHDREKSAWWLVVFFLGQAGLVTLHTCPCFMVLRPSLCTTSWRWRPLP
jgi:uncharacterized membrane protein YhaH (DUF805 family)